MWTPYEVGRAYVIAQISSTDKETEAWLPNVTKEQSQM